MIDSKPICTPMEHDVHLTATLDNDDPDRAFPHATVLGSLMYAAVGTRPTVMILALVSSVG